MSGRREPSLRANARARYLESASQDEAAALGGATPTPDPSPQGGGEGAPLDGAAGCLPAPAPGVPSALTARVRALYELSVVPVREIAQLAGVSERTIYKHARKGGWTPRVTRLGDGGTGGPGNIAARGVGGRFIALADSGAPVPRGLKALDPDGARVAVTACVQAERLAMDAADAAAVAAQARAAEASADRDARVTRRALDQLAAARLDLIAVLAESGDVSARAARLAARLHDAIAAQMTRLMQRPSLPRP